MLDCALANKSTSAWSVEGRVPLLDKEFMDVAMHLNPQGKMASAEFRFPVNTPDTKEGYYYRTIFEEYFPQEPAAKCVPSGKSIACSTVEALEWDASFKANADPSGRAMSTVHGKS